MQAKTIARLQGIFLIPPIQRVRESLRQGIQQWMDATALAYGYDDLKSVVGYADEPSVPKYHSEGLAFRRWRSQVWVESEKIAAEVLRGAPMPTAQELLRRLPQLQLPPPDVTA